MPNLAQFCLTIAILTRQPARQGKSLSSKGIFGPCRGPVRAGQTFPRGACGQGAGRPFGCRAMPTPMVPNPTETVSTVWSTNTIRPAANQHCVHPMASTHSFASQSGSHPAPSFFFLLPARHTRACRSTVSDCDTEDVRTPFLPARSHRERMLPDTWGCIGRCAGGVPTFPATTTMIPT